MKSVLGRTTGVVVDSGDGVTHSVPIYEGFALPNSIMRTDIGGRDVTRYLKLLLRKEEVHLKTTAEFETIRDIKEKCCYLSRDILKDDGSKCDQINYTLPDGNIISVILKKRIFLRSVVRLYNLFFFYR